LCPCTVGPARPRGFSGSGARFSANREPEPRQRQPDALGPAFDVAAWDERARLLRLGIDEVAGIRGLGRCAPGQRDGLLAFGTQADVAANSHHRLGLRDAEQERVAVLVLAGIASRYHAVVGPQAELGAQLLEPRIDASGRFEPGLDLHGVLLALHRGLEPDLVVVVALATVDRDRPPPRDIRGDQELVELAAVGCGLGHAALNGLDQRNRRISIGAASLAALEHHHHVADVVGAYVTEAVGPLDQPRVLTDLAECPRVGDRTPQRAQGRVAD